MVAVAAVHFWLVFKFLFQNFIYTLFSIFIRIFSEIFDSRSPGHIEIYFIKILVSIFYIFLCEEVSFFRMGTGLVLGN